MGNNRVYSVNEEEMNRLASMLGRSITSASDASSSMSSNFRTMTDGGLMGGAVNKLSKNLEKVTSIGNNIRSKIVNQTSSTFELEATLSQELDKYQEPQDFVKTDTRKYNSIDDIQLSKKDDKSVNEGQETEKVEEIADNSIKDEEGLFDQTKKETEMTNEIADNSIEEEEKLKDITGEEAKEVEEIADNSIKEEESLYNLTGEEAKEFKEIDDNSIDEEEKLKDITGEEAKETEELRLDAVKEEKQLKEATSGATEQVEYEQNTTQFASTGAGNSMGQQQGAQTSQEASTEGFSYSTSSSSNEEKEKEEEEKKKAQESALNEMMNNFSTYQNMERANAETEKNLQQENNS